MTEPIIRDDLLLGLDLGPASVGWALARLENGEPVALEGAGVRIFTEGVDNLNKGNDEASHAKARRLHRSQRRQTRRRANRLARLYRELADAGLLPRLKIPQPQMQPEATPSARKRAVESAERVARHEVLRELDQKLWTKLCDAGLAEGAAFAWLPYILRAQALDRKLDREELGRAIYHLAQKRGFRSNRKVADAEEAEAVALDAAAPDASSAPKKKKGKRKEGGKLAGSLTAYRELVDPSGRDDKARTIGEAYLRILREARPGHETASGEGTLHRKGEAAWRSQYEDEFQSIWNRQAQFDPSIQGIAALRRSRKSRRRGKGIVEREVPLREALYRTIFYQRPLKTAAGLIGCCELEDGRSERLNPETGELIPTKPSRRLAWAHPLAQRFRTLAMVNNTKILNGTEESPLSEEQRKNLLLRLEAVEKLTFTEARKLLGLEKTRFNFERNDSASEKSFPGSPTLVAFQEAFGSAFQSFDDCRRQLLFNDWYSISDPHVLEFRLAVHWGLGLESASGAAKLTPEELEAECRRLAEEAKRENRRFGVTEAEERFGRLRVSNAARKLAHASFQEGYCALSRTAIERLLPMLEQGVLYGEAWPRLYKRPKGDATDKLPPVEEVYQSLNSPLVARTLSEMRKVVNAIVAKYGCLPGAVRIEMARSLKASRDERQAIVSRQNINREARKNAKSIAESIGLRGASGKPSGRDILKVQLAQECGWVCPYSGRHFSGDDLRSGEVDIEHIVPRSMRPDDSFANLTLAFRKANSHKGGNLPHAAFASNPDGYDWEEILERVSAFRRTEDYMDATSPLPAAEAKSPERSDEAPSAKRKKPRAAKAREGKGASPKLRLFQLRGTRENPSKELKAYCEQFTNADLTQTGWATRYAAGYVGMLYGLPTNAPHEAALGKRRIFASTGQSTASLRKLLGKEEGEHWRNIDTILLPTCSRAVPDSVTKDSERARKLRADHRHHAVDAAIVAIASPRLVERATEFYEKLWRMPKEQRKAFRSCMAEALLPSWPGLYDDIAAAVYGGVDGKGREWSEMIVSHRVDKKARGSLHDQNAAKETSSAKIVVGEGPRRRRFSTSKNHHVLVYEEGKKVKGECVSLQEASDRKRKGEPLIDPDLAAGTGARRLLFPLFAKELLRIPEGDKAGVYVFQNVSSASNAQIVLQPHWFALGAQRSHPLSVCKCVGPIFSNMAAQRLRVSILGEIR